MLLLFYILSFGLTLFNQGIYWDDWYFFDKDKVIITQEFREMGFVWFAYLHNFLLILNKNIFINRVLVLLLYYFSALLLNNILKNIRHIDSSSRFFIVVFFLLFPVNSARISLVIMLYVLCYFLFFLGFWFLSEYLVKRKIIFRFLSLVIFFISFTLNSQMIFYSITFIYILYIKRKKIKSIIDFLKLVFSCLDFILLPFIYWVILNSFFSNNWYRMTYNKFYFVNFLKAIPVSFQALDLSFFEVIKQSLRSSPYFLLIIGTIVLYFYLCRIILFDKKFNLKVNFMFLFFGLYSFLVAVIPYFSVGRTPSLYDWNSRHQILVPLGASFILYFAVELVFNCFRIKAINYHLRLVVYSFLIVAFILLNISYSLDYLKDWFKQLSLIENFGENEVIRQNHTFIIQDKTKNLNAQRRNYRFYEYVGMMNYLFNNEKKFAIEWEEFTANDQNMNYYESYFFNYHYNLKDYVKEKPKYVVTINKGKTALNNLNLLKIMYLNLTNNQDFYEYIDKIVYLTVSEINPEENKHKIFN